VNLTNSPGPGITTFIPDAGKTITLAAQFTGVGGLNFNGPGTNLLQAANTYTGGTTLSQGTLAFGSGGSVADSTLTIPSGTAVAFASGNAVQNYTNNFTGPGDVSAADVEDARAPVVLVADRNPLSVKRAAADIGCAGAGERCGQYDQPGRASQPGRGLLITMLRRGVGGFHDALF
jgi:autotransporter-associated beta strand protein